MFQNVLVGIDGRPNGRDAIALSRRLLADGGRLTLAHVHPGALHPLHAAAPGVIREEAAASDKLLQDEREAAGVEAELVSVVGDSPGAALHVQAEEQGADLIVVGSSSRGPLGRVFQGDDTRQALNGAPCAVAIATAGYSEGPKPFASVGVAYNGTPEARAALEVAKQVALRTHAVVKALEVVTIPTYAYTGVLAPSIGEGLDLLLNEARKLVGQLPGVEGRAVYGLPGEELASFGDEVDLLVVGSRSYGPLRRLVEGGTSQYLQRHARCSLLILPRSAARPHDSDRPQTEQAPEDAPAAA